MARKLTSEKKVVVSSTPAAAAPARYKSGSAKRAARPAAPAEIKAEIFNVEPEAPAAAGWTATEPSCEAVALLAHSFWEARGCQGGSPEEDWLRAEQELRAAYTVK
jgi:hypothetical protein